MFFSNKIEKSKNIDSPQPLKLGLLIVIYLLIGIFMIIIPIMLYLGNIFRDELVTEKILSIELNYSNAIITANRQLSGYCRNIEFLSMLLSDRYAVSDDLLYLREFDYEIKKCADGAWRSVPENSDKNDAAVFIPAIQTVSNDRKCFYVKASRLLGDFKTGIANMPFLNLWIKTQDKGLIIWCAEKQKYVDSLSPAGYDNETENAVLKYETGCVWLSPFYDTDRKLYLLKLTAPYCAGNNHTGLTGCDIPISSFFDSLCNAAFERLGSTAVFGIDGKILYSNTLNKKIEEYSGAYSVYDVNDQEFREDFEKVIKKFKYSASYSSIYMAKDKRKVVFAARLGDTGLYVMNTIPLSAIADMIKSPVHVLRWLVIMMIGITFLSIVSAIARYIVRSRKFERKLAKLNVDLEKLVEERTKKLEEEIAERKYTEEALKKANERLKNATEKANTLAVQATSASNAKSEFLANMSHEIRTPMNGVIGMAELLLSTPMTEEQKDYAESIESSAQALLHIINDILDFSKIEAGKFELKPMPFDLNEIFDEVGVLLSAQCSAKRIELIMHFVPDTPRFFIGDAGRIRQILINLIGNAVKFTNAGSISVEVKCGSRTEKSAILEFKIEDTGIGMTESTAKSVFEKFTQADDVSTTRCYEGTGLGLAISKQLIEMMGGSVSVKSELGKGSVFTFYLNLPVDNEPEFYLDKISSVNGIDMTDLKILIVDDNQLNRRILREQLSMNGAVTDEASSAREALHKLSGAVKSGKPFNLALLDYYMPDMNGVELASAVKDDIFIKNTVLIMLSSSSKNNSLLTGGINSLFTDVISKPIRISQLMKAVKEAFSVKKESSCDKTSDSSVSELWHDKRILVVEDNPINQKVIKAVFKKMNIETDTADNGEIALSMLLERHYDIIFMDVQMPVMDGYEATHRIRESEKSSSKHIPIIALTAHVIKGDREKCLEAGMDDYIPKPVKKQAIIDVLNKYL